MPIRRRDRAAAVLRVIRFFRQLFAMLLFFPASWLALSLGLLGLRAPLAAASEAVQGAEDLGSIPILAPGALDNIVDGTGHLAEDIVIPASPRHDGEKKSLLRRMSKKHGKWDTNHPRSRLLDALYSFSRYSEVNTAELDRWRDLYKNVPSKQQHILETAAGYTQKLDQIEKLIAHNAAVCGRVVEAALAFYEIGRKELVGHIKASDAAGRRPDRISVSQSLKHMVRDWSTEGRSERDEAFPCIRASLEMLFPAEERSSREEAVRVLLPGSGLGRLGHEIDSMGGFEVTSNEWSMYMNLAYRFITRPTTSSKPLTTQIHPFIDGFSHHSTTANMLRAIPVPDTPPNTTTGPVLVEGDFTTIFKSQPEHQDAVVTHFFIDTARNVMHYLDTIHAVLKQGGYWVNFGPLLWGTGPWVQLSLDELIAVVKAKGFEFVEVPEEVCGGEITLEGDLVRSMRAVYGFDERALTRSAYAAQVWIVKKL